MKKWIVKSFSPILAVLGALFLKALGATLRWRMLGLAEKPDFWSAESPKIIAFWHNRQLMMPSFYTVSGGFVSGRVCAISSQHRDGRLIARVNAYLGIESVGGSSTRGGTGAFLGLLQKLKEGCNVGITPDGPRGPIYELKPGVVKLAQKAGVPIYPCACSAESVWTFNSWDRMFLPKPFSRAVVMVGDPIIVPSTAKEEDIPSYKTSLDQGLNQVTTLVDQFKYS